MSDLKRYRAVERCDKCRSAATTTKYCTDTAAGTFLGRALGIAWCHLAAGYLDHLHVTCANCGRVMIRVPVDTTDEVLTPRAVAKRQAASDARVAESRRQADEHIDREARASITPVARPNPYAKPCRKCGRSS